MGMNPKCTGEHNIFVAEVAATENELIVVTVCTQCDTVSFHSRPLNSLSVRLLKQEKEK